MLDSHYIANPQAGGGFTWTLVSRMGAMLTEIEARYGQRDLSWTPIGVEFSSDGPQIWFPGNCRNVAIQLGPTAQLNNTLACYQLAHECVHLLAPDGGRNAPVLEEGLATVFSEDFVALNFNRVGMTDFKAYIEAARKVRILLEHDVNAIKSLRAIEPSFKMMTAATFVAAGLVDVPENLVNELVAPFRRDE